jgi:CheY-like chemotaxis protein
MHSERIVLRAELVIDGRRLVAHTTEITARSAFVRTDEQLTVGEDVTLRLSFPRLLAPVELDAKVLAFDPGSGHGYVAGVMLEFARESDAIARLLAAPPTPAPGGSCRVLVVEDSAVMRDMVQLGAERYSGRPMRVIADTADRVEAALALIDEHAYDLAMVDLYLPGGLSGAELVRGLRARGSDLPVIGFSVGGASAREEFLAAGADLFLDKPVVLRDVFGTLERLMLSRFKEGE